MTDQELRDLEGTERANVEARVRCLRNIQVLLDAAVLEMQQYSSVVSRLNASTGDPATTLPTPRPQPVVPMPGSQPVVKEEKPEEAAAACGGAGGDQASGPKPTEETGAIPKRSAATPVVAAATTDMPEASEVFGTTSKVKEEVKEKNKEAEEIIKKMESPSPENPDEIRRRRLEKLQQNNQQT